MLGLVLWQMYTNKPMFEGLTFEQAAVALMTRTFQPKITEEDNIPPDLAELLGDCWLPNSDARPTYGMVYDRIRGLECERFKPLLLPLSPQVLRTPDSSRGKKKVEKK
jgi:hypothetical protein